MRHFRLLVMLLTVLMVVASPASVRAEPPAGDIRDIGATTHGQGYCFARQMEIGPLVIQGGRCYNFYVVRTDRGGFLGFGPPGAWLVAPGQIVRLNTPAGIRLRQNLQYLVPLSIVPTAIPINGAQAVNVQVLGQYGRLVIVVPNRSIGATRPVELGFMQR